MKKLLFLALIVGFSQCKSSSGSSNTGSVASLENTYWRLSEMNGVPVQTPENGKEVHIILSKADGERRLKGFGGCNGVGGNYTVDGNKIKFTTLSTKMFCAERMDIENFLTSSLESATTYKIVGESLELYEGETFLVKFESVYLK